MVLDENCVFIYEIVYLYILKDLIKFECWNLIYKRDIEVVNILFIVM